jgi:hypothetical protein
MKKIIALLIFLYLNVLFVFGQEYIIHLSGNNTGYILVEKDSWGKIQILPQIDSMDGSILITNEICSILPEEYFIYFFRDDKKIQSIVIDGDTTLISCIDGSCTRKVVVDNIINVTLSNGDWTKTVINGITPPTFQVYGRANGLIDISVFANNISTIVTSSSGIGYERIVDGNIITLTDLTTGYWTRRVIEGNITTITNSFGGWDTIVVENNTTTETSSSGNWSVTTVVGNTTTITNSNGVWLKRTVEGNSSTTTHSNGDWNKTIIDKQGNNVYYFQEGVVEFFL